MLDIFQRACIAAAAASSSLLQLVVGRVRKAQDHLAEVFAELVFLGQQLQHFLFRLLSGTRTKFPSPVKTAPVTLPLTGATKHRLPERRWKVAASRFNSKFVTLTLSPLR